MKNPNRSRETNSASGMDNNFSYQINPNKLSDTEKILILNQFSRTLESNSIDLDPEIAKVLNDHFHELL